jgi:hypothetical protein
MSGRFISMKDLRLAKFARQRKPQYCIEEGNAYLQALEAARGDSELVPRKCCHCVACIPYVGREKRESIHLKHSVIISPLRMLFSIVYYRETSTSLAKMHGHAKRS